MSPPDTVDASAALMAPPRSLPVGGHAGGAVAAPRGASREVRKANPAWSALLSIALCLVLWHVAAAVGLVGAALWLISRSPLQRVLDVPNDVRFAFPEAPLAVSAHRRRAAQSSGHRAHRGRWWNRGALTHRSQSVPATRTSQPR